MHYNLDLLGSILTEVTVVGIFCLIFLVLFVVAGIRQVIKNRDENHR